MNVRDDAGNFLDSTVELRKDNSSTYMIVFESRGPDRNEDYELAYDLVMTRLSSLDAVLIDGVVVSRDTHHLARNERRLLIKEFPFPMRLTQLPKDFRIGQTLRRMAAGIGRAPSAKGAGNRTKRIELTFGLPGESTRSLSWLAERLIAPKNSVEGLAVEAVLRPRTISRGQGFGLSVEARRKVEEYAMECAQRHFVALGAESVLDVSQKCPYDLVCIFPARELHVEVKGTTGGGTSILLTRNEVKHALSRSADMALFVVSEVELTQSGGKLVASGGKSRAFDPWRIDLDDLEPQTYSLTL